MESLLYWGWSWQIIKESMSETSIEHSLTPIFARNTHNPFDVELTMGITGAGLLLVGGYCLCGLGFCGLMVWGVGMS